MLLSIVILGVSVGWIVLSYLPSSAVAMPQFHFSPVGVVRTFPILMIAGVLVFLALQIWVVQTTATSVRRYIQSTSPSAAGGFRLTVRREILLTALPILFTGLLAAASYAWWQRLVDLG